MMIDLYQELGVKRTAAASAIRAAYRKRAKRAHPDAGGTQEGFRRLRLAHDVLTDAEKRARYDATGAVDEGTADNARAALLQYLSSVLTRVVTGVPNPARIDVVGAMRDIVNKEIEEIEKHRGEAQKRIARLREAAGRLRVREGDDVLGMLLRGQIDTAELSMRPMDEAVKRCRAAVGIIDAHEFERDESGPVWSFGNV